MEQQADEGTHYEGNYYPNYEDSKDHGPSISGRVEKSSDLWEPGSGGGKNTGPRNNDRSTGGQSWWN